MRDRIIGVEKVKVSQLRPAPFNFREHPEEQRRAFREIMREIGFAGAFLGRKRKDGKIELIDGHLRREELPKNAQVTVVITDLNRKEAKHLISVFDTVGDLATVDQTKFEELMKEVNFDSHDLMKMLEETSDITKPGNKEAETTEPPPEVEGMELEADEHYDYILVLARRRQDWNRLCALLNITKVRNRRSNRIGLGRAVEARKLIHMLEKKNGKLQDRGSVSEETQRSAKRTQDDPKRNRVRRSKRKG